MKKCSACLSNSLRNKYEHVSDYLYNVDGDYNYLECNDCGSFSLFNDISETELTKFYENYFTHSDNLNKGKFKYFKDVLIKTLDFFYTFNFTKAIIDKLVVSYSRKYLFIGGSIKYRILDFGCGNGDQLLLLKNKGHMVKGVDFDKKAIKVAIKKGINAKSVSELRTNEEYDIISLLNVIEHLPDPEMTLKMLFNNLSSNGKLMIETPNSRSFLSKRFKKNWRGLECPRHLVVFSNQGLDDLLLRCGFKISSVYRIKSFSFYLNNSNISKMMKFQYKFIHILISPFLLFTPNLRETNFRIYVKCN